MIVAHNNDYESFCKLLSSSIKLLQNDAFERKEYYLNRGGINLEKDVFRFITTNANNTIYANNIELVSGQKFPDIVAYVNKNKAYGIEVKTTKANKWKSTGSSIFEGTRVEEVQNIHLLFGKLSSPIQFRCRKYEDCLYDIAITHSPRYLIDMEISKSESIFAKVGVEYDELRRLKNPFKPIKNYFRKNLKKGDDLWWIDNNDESIRDFGVRLWGNLDQQRKEELRILALSYFPCLLGNNSKKYARLATWLVSHFGIVNHALRDTFTAGGKVSINGVEFPKIFEHLTKDLEKIIDNIKSIESDDIGYYWEVNLPIHDPVTIWKQECLRWCKSSLNKSQINVIKNILKIR